MRKAQRKHLETLRRRARLRQPRRPRLDPELLLKTAGYQWFLSQLFSAEPVIPILFSKDMPKMEEEYLPTVAATTFRFSYTLPFGRRWP